MLVQNSVKNAKAILLIILKSPRTEFHMQFLFSKDFESIYNDVAYSVSKSLDSIDNKYLNFKSIVLKDENHYVVPSVTIPKSIKNIYSKYADIDKVEYDSIISKLETSPTSI